MGVVTYKNYNLPPDVFFDRAASSLTNSQSPLMNKLAVPVRYIAQLFDGEANGQAVIAKNFEAFVGASRTYSYDPESFTLNNDIASFHYDRLSHLPYRRTVTVNTTKQLINAVTEAQAGDDILLKPGSYELTASRVYFTRSGTRDAPIRLRAADFGDVEINSTAFEGFVISGDNWVIQNLKINGVCQKHTQCEHALHLVGSNNVTVYNNQFTNFNSIIKANGSNQGGTRRYPDNVLIERNNLYNTSPRRTHTAVTNIDVVAGNDWVIRKNFIAANGKDGSDRTSYAAFIKGNAKRGLFDSNLVDCDYNLPQDNAIRVGLSFGGGGTGSAYCREGNCDVEHANGEMRNNIILNCAGDAGIYLNKAKATKLVHNTLINNTGIDVRFAASNAEVYGNALTSRIRERDQGTAVSQENIQIEASEIKSSQSVKSEAERDFCGYIRGKFSAAGAISGQCNVSIDLIGKKN